MDRRRGVHRDEFVADLEAQLQFGALRGVPGNLALAGRPRRQREPSHLQPARAARGENFPS